MFNRAWLAGGIPRTACVAAYEPICAVSLADSYINRANPGTKDAAPGVAPTWSAELGWTFNGTSQYLITGITSNGAYSVFARFSNGAGTYGALFAGTEFSSAGRFWIFPRYDGGAGTHSYAHGGIAASVSGFASSGVIGLSGRQPYLNGSPDGPATPAWTGSGVGAFIGAFNNGGPQLYGRYDIQAVYIYNVPITPTQVRAVTDAMNMLPMRPQLPRFRSWLTGGALTQFRQAFGLRTGSRGVPE